MTINLFYLEKGSILIRSVQLVLHAKAKKKKKLELSVMTSKTFAVQYLKDCKPN